jgi:cysteinyl-tRNA synthetase
MSTLTIYNSLTRKKEKFEPLNAPFVGMYVCGPTVYGDPHLGHARPAITFDVVFRYLKNQGYKVRYVRNITDVGHLEQDADSGEDKIAKKARIEQLEPMEVVQHYTLRYHEAMSQLNCLPPSIEPSASGHIQEQIKLTEDILKAGFAYEANGSVYFDVKKYNEKYHYGKLSGRIVEELEAGAGNERRTLEGQDEKRSPNDFALWKKAEPEHIMRWASPWGEGFPGWHIECSAMSTKYLGTTFDIHGGGMDLLFPHHECEIAQSMAGNGVEAVRYWLHNNMITINGQKMGKSLGNAVNLEQFFTGEHPLLEKGYTPMTIRFFILQSHYRSTLDFSNEALQAAEKGYARLMNSLSVVNNLQHTGNINGKDEALEKEINALCDGCYDLMNDDFNTAMVLANLFELSSKINSFKDKHISLDSISKAAFDKLKNMFNTFVSEILGLKAEDAADNSVTDALMQLLIDIRKEARDKKDFATSDKVRDELLKAGIQLKDGKDGTEWSHL